MSNGHLNWAWQQVAERDLEKADALVLLCIADMVNKAGEAWPSLGYIAQRTNMDVSSVQRSIKAHLLPKQLLERTRRGHSWLYKLLTTSNSADRKPGVAPGISPVTEPGVAPGKRSPEPGATPGMNQALRLVSDQPNQASRLCKPGVAPLEPGVAPGKPFLEPPREDSVPDGTEEPASAVSSASARDLLFTEGVVILQHLLGVMDSGARNFLGKLLKASRDDASLVLTKLREARRQPPLDTGAWLIKACVPFRNAGLALIAEEGSSVQAAEYAAAWERLGAVKEIGHA